MRSKVIILISLLFPIFSIASVRHLNTTGDNRLLLAMILSLCLFIALTALQHKHLRDYTYPAILVPIAFSLLSICWFRSTHLLGVDIHYEYYLYRLTALNGWSVVDGSPLNYCLAISVLPATIQKLLGTMNTPYEEMVFKGIFVVVSSFTPLIVYFIAKRYIGGIYAFFAALLVMFQVSYLATASDPRTSIARFFFALSILLIVTDRIGRVKKNIALTLALICIALSHYTTAYITIILLLCVVVANMVMSRKFEVPVIPIVLFTLFVVVWHVEGTLDILIAFSIALSRVIRLAPVGPETLSILDTASVKTESAAPFLYMLFGKGVSSIAQWVNLLLHWGCFIAIGLGFLYATYKKLVDTRYIVLSAGCIAALVATLAIGYLSLWYSPLRLYSQMIIILGIFPVAGVVLIGHLVRIKPVVLLMAVTLPILLFSTGVAGELTGNHSNMLVSNEAPDYTYLLVHEEEIEAARWAKANIPDVKGGICVPDGHGKSVLMSYGLIRARRINGNKFFGGAKIPDSYVFLSYNNVVNGKLVYSRSRVEYDMADFSNRLKGKELIFDNGGCQIWR